MVMPVARKIGLEVDAALLPSLLVPVEERGRQSCRPPGFLHVNSTTEHMAWHAFAGIFSFNLILSAAEEGGHHLIPILQTRKQNQKPKTTYSGSSGSQWRDK